MTNLGQRVNGKKLIWRMNVANPAAGHPRLQVQDPVFLSILQSNLLTTGLAV
jgi:hypothetical protein